MLKIAFNRIVLIVGMLKGSEIYDVLIIGAGGSGLACAIFCKSQGLKVGVISKVHPLQSHTVAAQGGINAALGNITTDDTKWHIFDTIKASDMLADQDSVRDMCQAAGDVIKLLEELGVEFDRTSSGTVDQKIYGGQTTNFGRGGFAHRACYSKDKTGHTIMDSLYSKALDLDVDFYNYHFVLDILIENHSINLDDSSRPVSMTQAPETLEHIDSSAPQAVICLDIEKGHFQNILARNVVLATGGYSQVYDTATSAALCTGDGVGIVARMGLPLQDMEFVQFHPTALSRIGVLVTEAARSAGGKLYNGHSERFMEKYSPKLKELSTRDVVSRAIFTEIIEGRGAGPEKDHVLLDLTFMSKDEIKAHLPTVYENCLSFLNIDPSNALIPVKPAAHYTMGGIATDAKCRVISGYMHQYLGKSVESVEHHDQYIPGLYAIGEAACISVHGAGRLGCNSLLDLIVFAKVAALDISSRTLGGNSGSIPLEIQNKLDNNITSAPAIQGLLPQFNHLHQKSRLHKKDCLQQRDFDDLSDQEKQYMLDKQSVDADSLLLELRKTMSACAGVFRSSDLLEVGLKQLERIKNSYDQLKFSDSLAFDQREPSKGDTFMVVTTSPWNIELIKYLELGNMLIAAEATLRAALWRKETRGAHMREDFNNKSDEFLAHSLVYRKAQSWLVLKRPVRILEEYNQFFSRGI